MLAIKISKFLIFDKCFPGFVQPDSIHGKKWNVYCTIQLHHSIYMHATMLPLFLFLSLSIYLPVCLLV